MITIKYPPNFDGELHIQTKPLFFRDKITSFEYSFIHSNSKSATGKDNADEWDTLVAAAKAIIAQDNRKRK